MSVVIGGFHGTLVIDEELGALGSTDHVEGARRLLQVEKAREIVGRTCIRKVERTFLYAEIVLYESQNAAEVEAIVVHVTDRGVGGNDYQRSAKPVLVVALTLIRHRQKGRRLDTLRTFTVVSVRRG